MNFEGIFKRLKDDILPKDKFYIYYKQLELLKENNFNAISLVEAFKKFPYTKNIAAIRHDVDTNDLIGNNIFFEIEKSLNIKSTYYFRLCTVNKHLNLIKELLNENFEVGYHYEEPAQFMKRNKIKKISNLKKYYYEIQEEISKNIKIFENRIDHKIYSICSHGDWINNKYGFVNSEFINSTFLKSLNILFEAYDPFFMSAFNCYITDTGPVGEIWLNNFDIGKALKTSNSSMYVLTHERTFHTNINAAWESNFKTLIEKLNYKFF